MENFPDVEGGVVMLLEPLGEADEFRVDIAKKGAVAEDAGVDRLAAGEHGGAGGAAEWVLAVPALEHYAGLGEGIDGRGGGEGVAEAMKLRTHVVRHEEEDVVFPAGGGGGGNVSGV
jgi:hypothetical protein